MSSIPSLDNGSTLDNDSTVGSRPASHEKVFDKYMLPRVAFTLITIASMAGATLTGLRHGFMDWPTWVLRWGAFWTTALLFGSQMWKVFYLRPSIAARPAPAAVEYGDAMMQLHRKWQRVLGPLAILLLTGDMLRYALGRPGAMPFALVAVAMLGLGLVGSLMDVEWIAITGLAATIVTIGALDTFLEMGTAPSLLLMANRGLHLLAFSAWLGGAMWNVFIAVPAALPRTNMDTVILANFQLERFRVVVRTVFPTIILTGVVQAWAALGWSKEAWFHSVWGDLVLFKIFLIVALVGVFITCPMWHACSPIRGVCNLDDLNDD